MPLTTGSKCGRDSSCIYAWTFSKNNRSSWGSDWSAFSPSSRVNFDKQSQSCLWIWARIFSSEETGFFKSEILLALSCISGTKILMNVVNLYPLTLAKIRLSNQRLDLSSNSGSVGVFPSSLIGNCVRIISIPIFSTKADMQWFHPLSLLSTRV